MYRLISEPFSHNEEEEDSENINMDISDQNSSEEGDKSQNCFGTKEVSLILLLQYLERESELHLEERETHGEDELIAEEEELQYELKGTF